MLDYSSDLHFPVARDVQHVSPNLMAICVSSTEKQPVRASPPFLIGFFVCCSIKLCKGFF